jgi:hypothetical protein
MTPDVLRAGQDFYDSQLFGSSFIFEPVVHQNLPRTEKAVNPCRWVLKLDVLLTHSANRVDPNPTKKEGWAPRRLTSDLVPK